MENVKIFLSNILKKEIKILLDDDEKKIRVVGNVKSLSLEDKENISFYKEELIKILKKEKSRSRGDFKSIRALENSRSYPISDAQRRLWVLGQFENLSVAYNMPFDYLLKGEYDIENFEKAIYATIERHEVLRTVFKEDQNEASEEVRQWIIQMIDFKFKINHVDFRNKENRKELAESYIVEDEYKAFDFETGPLIRASLIRLEEDEYIFYWNMHHIISDGWSGQILVKDVFAFYEAFKENKTPGLAKLRIQYKDYSTWQLEQLQTDRFKKHSEYWLQQLGGKELPLLDLPTTKQRPRLKTNNGRTMTTYLSKEITRKIKAYSNAHGGTLFMGLLASLNIILYRYTRQTDIIIGSPIAGREHVDLQNQIGYYANTLALRNQLNPDENFDEFFSRIKQNTIDAYSHQMYPFDRLVEELNLIRDTSRNAVFDFWLVLQNNRENSANFDLSEEQLNQIVDLGVSSSKFDFLVDVDEQGEYLSFSIGYNTDVYDMEMIEKFIIHYKTLLSKLMDEPSQPLGSIDYLSDEENSKLILGLNNTEANFEHKTVIELFEDQVEKTPTKIAVEFENVSLTYRELNDRINLLANFLKTQYAIEPTTSIVEPSESGKPKQKRLGVMLERSAESIIAMIGVMKTGACYVPIDHNYPTDRIEYIIQDAKLEVIISEKKLFDKHEIESKKIVDIRKIDFEKGNKNNPEDVNNLADGCFVIYTSGSTGKPKGVLQTHLMMTTLIQWDIHYSGLKTGLKQLQYASFSFDASLHDVFFCLSAGGCVYIVKESSRLDYPTLANEIAENKIEVLSLPFAALNAFFREVDLNRIENHSIKHIISTGEQLYVNHSLMTFLENNPNIDLHNHYGPSETHVITGHYMSASLGNIVHRSPIGRPVSNGTVYLLDDHKKLVPQGVLGEFYFGGDNLAMGYLNREDLTREKFLPHPFIEGKLVYKSGDLGRWLPNGDLEFVGRIDDQVKIRGYRVELGEIEYALTKYHGIEEVIVVAKALSNGINLDRQENYGQNELAAYFVSKNPQNTNDLRNFLKKMLPDYMIPAFYVQMSELPLTSNGKIDKRALPNPHGIGISSGTEYLAPRNETEEKMVKIWESVLQKENIGIRDDFFVLGGHSLKAMKVVSKINREFQSGLKIGNIFISPTIEDLSHNIDFALSQKKLKQNIKNLKEIEL